MIAMHTNEATMTDVLDLRSRLGVSQQRFAQLIGVSFVTVSAWERGRWNPSGLYGIILVFLEKAMAKSTAKEVILKLRDCHGNHMEILRTLIQLEGKTS